MKKGSGLTAEKILELRIPKKLQQEIKFNLSPCNLACFKGKEKSLKSKCKIQASKQLKTLAQQKIDTKSINTVAKQEVPAKERQRTLSSRNNFSEFNEQVVIMQYDNIDVYIDNSKCKKDKSCSDNKKSEVSSDLDEDIVSSCVRMISEETDNTSNALQTPPHLTPRNSYYQNNFFESDPRSFSSRNQRSTTIEEGRNFWIEFEEIEQDGRTTVMVKNIPNKYTQESLLEEFSVKFENRFDFFYLPIDKDNGCNVGYAFVNFINVAYLKQFYLQFHNKRWKSYKSSKICNICYARYQGTLELANHFRHSKILQNRDRRLKPLIGVNETNSIKDIEEIVRIQRNRE